jgi:DNA repair protein RadC
VKAARYAVKTIKVSLRVAEPCTGHANNPADAVAILRPIFDALDADQEHAVLLALSNQNQVTGYKTISSGASNASLIDPRIVFRAALQWCDPGALTPGWLH